MSVKDLEDSPLGAVEGQLKYENGRSIPEGIAGMILY
jgi:hypothetical protein